MHRFQWKYLRKMLQTSKKQPQLAWDLGTPQFLADRNRWMILQKWFHKRVFTEWLQLRENGCTLTFDPLCKYLTLLNLQPKKRMNHASLFTFLDSDCFYFVCQQNYKLEFVKNKIASKGWPNKKPGGLFCFAGLFFYCQFLA